jgi:hypothetical protein
MSARWRPEPLTIVALVASLAGSFVLYDKSAHFLVAGDRLIIYAAIPLAPIAVVLLVAIMRGEPSAVRRFAMPLAVAGLLTGLLHGMFAWGAFDSPTLCGAASGCNDGLGSRFLDLSWFSWLAMATYFATVAAAYTLALPSDTRVDTRAPG